MISTDEEMAAAHAPAADATNQNAEPESDDEDLEPEPEEAAAAAPAGADGLPNEPPPKDEASPPPLSPDRAPRRPKDETTSPPDRARHPRGQQAKAKPKTNGTGVAPAPGSGQWVNKHDITLLWPEMIERLARDDRFSPSDLKIAVMRITPDSPPYQVGNEFDASLALGSDTQSPVDALLGILVTYYHLQARPIGPATYEIRWRWQKTSLDFGRCKVFFPHQNQCNHPAPDPNAQRSEPSFPGAPAAPRAPHFNGYGPPPPQQHYGQPGYAQGFAPPQYPSAPDPEIARLNEELRTQREQNTRNRETAAYNQATLDFLMKERTEARAAAAAAPPVGVAAAAAPAPATGAPAAGAPTVSIAQEAANILMAALGLTPGQPGVTAGHPAPGAPTTIQQDAFVGIEAALKTVQKLRNLGPQIDRVFSPDSPVVEAEVVDDDPVKVSETGANWRDGRPMRIARNKETKNVDFVETALNNPVVAETAMDWGNKLGSVVVDGIAKVTGVKVPGAGEPEVVSSTPPGATDASGDDWTK